MRRKNRSLSWFAGGRAALVLALFTGVLPLLAAGCAGEPTDEADVVDAAADAGQTEEDAVQDTVADVPKVFTGKCAGGPTMCDDGNPCTEDECDPFTGCSNVVKQCKDEDPCTVDFCDIANGDCRHDVETCDDNNICTVDVCKPGVGCVVDSTLNCDDGDMCTSDGCSPATGCISETLDCDDGLTCTTDSCDAKSGCIHVGPDGGQKCCEKANDCADNSPCTAHKCVAGLCETEAVFGCCAQNVDCDDGNPCTKDTCSAATGQCSNVYVPAPGCCANHSDCHDGDDCTSDQCMNGKCGYDVLCCSDTSDCEKAGSLGLCADVTCTAGGCGAVSTGADTCCASGVATTGFEESDTIKFTLLPATNGAWGVDGAAGAAKSGQFALVYKGADAPIPGGASVARALLAPITLPAATEVTLRFWLTAQPGPASPKEVFRVRVRTAAGEWHVWQQNGSSPSWKFVSINLSAFAARAATREVQILFDVQPSTQFQPTAKYRIDDLTIQSTCATKTCTSAAQCNDQLAASKEACVAGKCVYAADPAYCEAGDSASCNDDDFCTTDYCSGNSCKHFTISKCCHNDGECNDKDVCSVDACVNKKCVNKKLPTDGVDGCCATVSECDDANPCTVDACPAVGLPCQHTKTDPTCCVGDEECDDQQLCTIDTCSALKCSHKNECCKTDGDCDDGDAKCTTDKCSAEGKCSWTPTGAAGCCEKAVIAASFENKKLHGFALESSLKTSMWQAIVGGKAFKGKGALYYGNLAKSNFDDGQSKGTVTSAPIEIAAKERTQLTFALYMDSETSTTYDKFEVLVIDGAKTFKVWDKKAVGFKIKEWGEHVVDLSAFSGKSVKVQFVFDTSDGVANTGEGVYLDEVRLDRSCGDFTCNAAADCDDGHTFSKDTCTSGICGFSL